MAHILARNPEIELKAPQTVVRMAKQNARTSTPRYQVSMKCPRELLGCLRH
jgi:hypothetical protein